MRRDRQDVWWNFGANFDRTWSVRFCYLGTEDDITENSLEQLYLTLALKTGFCYVKKWRKGV